jgi:transcriptional regulator GlxA family with amidase domain
MLSHVGNLTDQLTPPAGMVVASLGDVAACGDVHVPTRGGLPPRAFRRVREYILAHLEENLSNRVLAEFVGLSASYFSHAFKQSAGVSPHRFVLQSRIAHVKHLLVETDLPLAQIAVTAGFFDQSQFSRRFHELVGITPSRFRWLRR